MALLSTSQIKRLNSIFRRYKDFKVFERMAYLDEDGSYLGASSTTVDATTANTFTVDSDSETGKIIIDVALGAADKSLTLTNAALTADRVITFPNVTGTVSLIGATEELSGKTLITPTIASFANAAHDHSNAAGGGALASVAGLTGTTESSFTVKSTATTGKIKIQVAAGAADKTLTLTNTALTADRTIAWPDAAGNVVIDTATQTLSAKTLTTPVIASFTNAAHNHQAAAGGGQIVGRLALSDFSITGGANKVIGTDGAGNLDLGAAIVSMGDTTITGDLKGVSSLTSTVTSNLSADVGGEFYVNEAGGGNVAFGSAAAGLASGAFVIFSPTGANGSFVISVTDNSNDKKTILATGTPTNDATITLPAATATLATIGLSEVLTSKTLTAPSITSASNIKFLSASNALLLKAAAQATAERSLTVPDCGAADKYVVVTSETDGTIGDAQIKAAAAIAYSKLATLTSGNLLIGSAGNVATSTAMQGDAAIIADGTLTIAANAVTVAKTAAAVQDLMPNLLVTASAEAGHARTITIQARDAANNNLAQRCIVRFFVNATAEYEAPSPTATDTFDAPGAGSVMVVNTPKADYTVITDASGTYNFVLTHNDAGTSRYVTAEMDGRAYSSGEIAFDAV